MQVASTSRMKKVLSSPSDPWDNGHIENVHNFLKKWMWKHVSSEHTWDEVAHIACAADNFVPDKHSKESTFFLMFGWDAYTPLVKLLNLNLRYVCNNMNLLVLDTLWDIYALETQNINFLGEDKNISF